MAGIKKLIFTLLLPFACPIPARSRAPEYYNSTKVKSVLISELTETSDLG